mgnify:FL=1
MNLIVRLTLGIFSLILVSACTAISEEECRLGDWYQVGLQDGQAGKKNYAATYNKDCSEYKVKVDRTLYNEGRAEGLKSFCTYENGVVQGSSLNGYSRVCPASLSKAFLDGYTPHYNLAKAKRAVGDAESKLADIKSQLGEENLEKDKKKNLKSQLKSATARLERAQSEMRKQEMTVELHKTNREIEHIQAQLDAGDLSSTRTQQLAKRRDKLIEKRDFIEKLNQASNTIITIKDLADMF